jgi:hypothetical protein
MSFTQLDPPMPYGPEHHLIRVTAIDETGEIWCAPNSKVRVQANWTMGCPGLGRRCQSRPARPQNCLT